MIGHKDMPSRSGGIEVVVERISTILAAQGHQVTAFNRFDETGTPDKPSTYKGIDIRYVVSPQIPGINAAVASFVATLQALKTRPDVIHYHAEGPAMACILASWRHVPTVVTVHGLDWQRSKWGRFAKAYLRFAERTLARHADEVIVLSPGNQDYFRQAYRRETHLIPNGMPPHTYAAPKLIREKWGLEKDGYILFLARITVEKGLHYLLEAYQALHTDKPLVIAGTCLEASYQARLDELARDNPNIRFVGFVTGEAMRELYSNCCCYCLPSEIEGMPLSLLEALSYGCPCVVSDIPENTRIAEAYVHPFRSRDVKALEGQLSAVLAHPMTQAQRDEQVRYIREHYNWDAIVSQTVDVYRAAIARHQEK